MKGDKTSKNKLTKPVKGTPKSKKEMSKKPKSKTQNPKSTVISPKSSTPKSAPPKADRNPKYDALRKEAEEILKSKKGVPDKVSDMDFPELLHEFMVYQAELEIQNEELRVAQRRLEESQSKYVDLYDFAPIGYFTFDKHGKILEVNLAGAQLLGIERSILVKTSFPIFIMSSYKTVFFSHLKKVLESGTKQTCELKIIKKKDGSQFYAHLESIAVSDNAGNHSCRTAISDISKQKQLADEIKRLGSFPQLDPNPVLEVNSSGIIVFSNAAAILTLFLLEFSGRILTSHD